MSLEEKKPKRKLRKLNHKKAVKDKLGNIEYSKIIQEFKNR